MTISRTLGQIVIAAAVLSITGMSHAAAPIPLFNGDFEAQTWRSYDNVTWYQAAVQPGTQAPNYNQLEPRFGVPDYGKTAISGSYSSGNIGPNGEGNYSERNDLGFNEFFNCVNGQLPGPANGTNFFCIQPSSPSFTPGTIPRTLPFGPSCGPETGEP